MGNIIDDAEGLEHAATDPYFFTGDSGIPYPEGETTEWYGFRRHHFVLDGSSGFIVEPPNPAPGLPWSWCIQWPEAFVPRTPALKLLARGFHHVYLDVFSTFLNEEGVRKLEKFYAMLQAMRFHRKCVLFGMSYGGLFSLRWAAEHPETVGAIWLDAPVCNLAFRAERDENNTPPDKLPLYREAARQHFEAYHVKDARGLREHPLNPLNNYMPIVRAKIPILAFRNGEDQTVLPQNNIDLLEEKMLAAGGRIQVLRRDAYGHHPHGMDDPAPLVNFILKHYPAL